MVRSGDVLIRHNGSIERVTLFDGGNAPSMDQDDRVITADELSRLEPAKHVAIDGCSSLLAIVDPLTLSCLLAGSVAAPGSNISIPWNGALSGQIQFVSVDGKTESASTAKLIVAETNITLFHEHKIENSLLEKQRWKDSVSKKVPGQESVISQLVDLVWSCWNQRISVGIVIEGSCSESLATDLAFQFAHLSSLPVHRISITDLFTSKRGQAEHSFDMAIANAVKSFPAFIILENLESLTNSAQGQRLAWKLERILDDFQQMPEMSFVLAPVEGRATLVPLHLRRSLRLDRILTLNNLGEKARFAALSLIAGKSADPAVLRSISTKTRGFSLGDLRHLYTEAVLSAFQRKRPKVDESDWETSLVRIRPSSLDEHIRPSPPSRPLSQLAGIDSILAKLRLAIVEPLINPEAYNRLGIRRPKGVLLHGPPGVGKTCLALGVAGEANAAVLEARGCDLISAVVGESESAIRDLFEKARSSSPAIIIIDQMETLAPRRGLGHSQTHDRVLSCLLTELDGVKGDSEVTIIATTSFRSELDDAILRPGRLDLQIEIGLPDFQSRLAILKSFCDRIPLADNVDLAEIARDHTQGYSGADLLGICTEAAMAALRRDLHATRLEKRDFK